MGSRRFLTLARIVSCFVNWEEELLACGIPVILDWIILCGGAVLCPAGLLAAPLVTPHWRQVAAPPLSYDDQER